MGGEGFVVAGCHIKSVRDICRVTQILQDHQWDIQVGWKGTVTSGV